MRVIDTREMELVVGGYSSYGSSDWYDSTYVDGATEVTAGANVSDAELNDFVNVAQTATESQLGEYVGQRAASFGINIGPVRVTPIFNPFSGPNSIRYGARARVAS